MLLLCKKNDNKNKRPKTKGEGVHATALGGWEKGDDSLSSPGKNHIEVKEKPHSRGRKIALKLVYSERLKLLSLWPYKNSCS